jgi:hypothetical protein
MKIVQSTVALLLVAASDAFSVAPLSLGSSKATLLFSEAPGGETPAPVTPPATPPAPGSPALARPAVDKDIYFSGQCTGGSTLSLSCHPPLSSSVPLCASPT